MAFKISETMEMLSDGHDIEDQKPTFKKKKIMETKEKTNQRKYLGD